VGKCIGQREATEPEASALGVTHAPLADELETHSHGTYRMNNVHMPMLLTAESMNELAV
jgi:hypothetical protein